MSKTLVALCGIAVLTIVVGVASFMVRGVNAQESGKGQDSQDGQVVKPGRQTNGTFVGPDGTVYTSQKAFVDAGRRCPVKNFELTDDRESSGLVTTAALAPGSVTINTYFWVIQANGTAGVSGTGFVSAAAINAQINVLNNAFAGAGPGGNGANTPFRFRLAGGGYVVNSSWYNAGIGTAAEFQMKSSLRTGSFDDLNIYLNMADGNLGYATFPSDADANPELDGVVAFGPTLPGSNFEPYNLGDTITHEVGHWLGLFHTFQGGCTGNGDFVSDTPAEASPAFGCAIGRDSCRNNAGADPVTNFMDYSDDSCMFRFSSGQSARMDSLYTTFRLGQ